LSPEDLKTYLQGRIQTSQMLLVVVGNTTVEELQKMVAQSFGNVEKGDYVYDLPEAVDLQAPSLKIVHRDLPTKYIRGQFPAPLFSTPEGYSMALGMRILRSRVWEEVRTKRSLSYAPSAGFGPCFANYGLIYVTAVDVDTTMRVMMHELEKMTKEPVTQRELDNHKNVYITDYYMQNESNQGQAEMIARYELSGAGYGQSAHFVNNVRQVTPEKIQDVCAANIKNIQFVILGAPDNINVSTFMF
jgi:zinc protease